MLHWGASIRSLITSGSFDSSWRESGRRQAGSCRCHSAEGATGLCLQFWEPPQPHWGRRSMTLGTANPSEPGITAPSHSWRFRAAGPYHWNNLSFFRRDLSGHNRCPNVSKVDWIKFQQLRVCPLWGKQDGALPTSWKAHEQKARCFSATLCFSAKPQLKRTQTSTTQNIQKIIQGFHQDPTGWRPTTTSFFTPTHFLPGKPPPTINFT